MRRVWLSLLLLACAPEVPEGVYVCDVTSDCPPGMTCQGGLCFRGEADAGPCVPQTCEELRANCGALDDGCGTEIQCGECPEGRECGAEGIPNVCGCPPQSCDALGVECGEAANGCGATIDCGGCAAGVSCVEGRCECDGDALCEEEGFDCGNVETPCGDVVSCGDCGATRTCGAGGPNRCGVGTCTPDPDACEGMECGMAPDGCGDLVPCGTCAAPQTCGGGGEAGRCGCTPTTCAAAAAACGSVVDGCGASIDCGECPPARDCTTANQCVCAMDRGGDTAAMAFPLGNLMNGSMATYLDEAIYPQTDEDWVRWDFSGTAGALQAHTLDVHLRRLPGNFELAVFIECSVSAEVDSPTCTGGSTPIMHPTLGPGCVSDVAGTGDEHVTIERACNASRYFAVVRRSRAVGGSPILPCDAYELGVSLSVMTK